MVGVLPGIAEPDTTFLSDLPEKRPAVRGEQEWHVVHAPQPAGRLLLGSSRIATAIAPGLVDDGGALRRRYLHHLGLKFGQALLKLLPLVFELLFGFSGQC